MDDTFEKCHAGSGGAIYASEFQQLEIAHSKFRNNFAFDMIGENLFAEKFGGTLTIRETNFDNNFNSVYINDGYDLRIINSTFEKGGENVFQKSRKSNLAGGLHILNMNRISRIHNIFIQKQFADYGGAIYIGLDQENRFLGYNEVPYLFERINIENCQADVDGGGMLVSNIRKMNFTDGSKIEKCRANNGKGGAINFICLDPDLNCDLYFHDILIHKNSAKQGGGINYEDVQPKFNGFKNKTLISNYAAIYGNQIASFPIMLVKFTDRMDAKRSFEFPEKGRRKNETFVKYINTGLGRDRAAPPLLKRMSNNSQIIDIHPVFSGTYMREQYIGFIDNDDQICTNIMGSTINLVFS